ncbi:MAG: response regulator [Spirochaetaceae bacterium]|nr:response regulator [Spirochaetaceae bacterium]
MKSILIVDDDELMIESIKIMLEKFSVSVTGYTDPFAGSDIAIRQKFDLILLDLKMPGLNGAEISIQILKARPDARILMLTSYPMDPLIQKAINAGVLGVVKKPFEIGKILKYLEMK